MTRDLIAVHRIHRPGKKKGETEVIEPGTHFVASNNAQYAALVEAGAARPNPKKASKGSSKGGKTPEGRKDENPPAAEGSEEGGSDGNGSGEVPGV